MDQKQDAEMDEMMRERQGNEIRSSLTELLTFDEWREEFDERQLGLIDNCVLYARNAPSGLPGHQLMLIINKMFTILEHGGV